MLLVLFKLKLRWTTVGMFEKTAIACNAVGHWLQRLLFHAVWRTTYELLPMNCSNGNGSNDQKLLPRCSPHTGANVYYMYHYFEIKPDDMFPLG